MLIITTPAIISDKQKQVKEAQSHDTRVFAGRHCGGSGAAFSHYTLTNSLGVNRKIQVFSQFLPFREGDDEETDAEAPPEPYVLVKMPSGELPEQDAQQNVDVKLIVCVCDPALNRQGYRDALHVVNEIVRHYARDGIVANRYEAQHPIRWAVQEEAETHPYYFAAVGLTFHAPAIFKEVPET